MALTPIQAETVVQKSIPEAGGFHGPHHEGKTLDGSGLKRPDQRRNFRQRVVVNVDRDHSHTIQLEEVPHDPQTIAQAREAVTQRAKER